MVKYSTSNNKNRLFLSAFGMILFAAGCITPFEPEYHKTDELLVVDGSFIKGQETQVIVISKISPITQREFKPVENCEVKVTDDSGNEFAFSEESPGKYVATINDELIQYDALYKLVFSTPDGNMYESEYQRMLQTEPVDSVYAIKEYHYSHDLENESIYGMQFYFDLDVSDSASKYYRWQIEETFEINAKEDIWGVYDGNTIETLNIENLKVCWRTQLITGLYSASTVGLSKNRIRKIPAHFKLDESDDLKIKYCATVYQYALNEDAYNYWEQKRAELYESGGIYTRQPDQPRSNIFNVNKPDEQVRGFFWASSRMAKHLFLENPFHKVLHFPYFCKYFGMYSESNDLSELKENLLNYIHSFEDELPDPPIYITRNFTNFDVIVTPWCADCRKIRIGNTTKRPDFWE